ncbi:hypothetical protein KY284_029095 [Solanum tuberosum]|nr:hypothetical protein KY284_029095 [Solanum tuberosum]
MSIKIEKILFRGRSKYQDIMIFQPLTYGKVIVLDGIIQHTERDVLIVGGGMGFTLREVLRYPSVEKVDLVEIDDMVVNASRKYFPDIAKGYEDPRATLYVGDGNAFVKNTAPGTYDAIIVDSSDPIGPSNFFFEKPFFEAVSKALRPGGVYSTQGESGLCDEQDKGNEAEMVQTCKEETRGCASIRRGAIGFVICSTEGHQVDFKNPVNKVDVDIISAKSESPLKYYNSEVHTAVALPTFAQKMLCPKK